MEFDEAIQRAVSYEEILEKLENVFIKLREIKKYVSEQKELICDKYPNEKHGYQVLHYLHKSLLGFIKEKDEMAQDNLPRPRF